MVYTYNTLFHHHVKNMFAVLDLNLSDHWDNTKSKPLNVFLFACFVFKCVYIKSRSLTLSPFTPAILEITLRRTLVPVTVQFVQLLYYVLTVEITFWPNISSFNSCVSHQLRCSSLVGKTYVPVPRQSDLTRIIYI